MIRRLLAATAAASAVALVATTAAPAHAGSVKAYLNQMNDDCSAGTAFEITLIGEDSGACVIIPRVLVNGEGADNESEAFATGKKFKTYTIDATKPMTGTFALFTSSGLRAANGPGMVAADFTIKMARKTIGTVRVEGPSTPAGPVTKAFSLKIPASLNRVKTNKITVSVQWVTCVGLCGVAVSGASYFTLPTR